jgi:hypothetical protein
MRTAQCRIADTEGRNPNDSKQHDAAMGAKKEEASHRQTGDKEGDIHGDEER